MSSFTDPLEVRQLPGGGQWQTLRAMHYYTDCAPNEGTDATLVLRCRTRLIVHDGFVTDFASIPQLFWTVMGHPAGRYAQAAVLHDWLYCRAELPRKSCDAIFLEAMAVLGVPAWQRWAMWAAVRVGGGRAYGRG